MRIYVLCLRVSDKVVKRSDATPWGGPYSSSKAALHSLTDTLDMELRPLGVHVMLIALDSTRSNIAANGAVPELPDNTFYAAFRNSLAARPSASQERNGVTPTSEAAHR
jgi:short-subunit dehydrogenase